MELVYRTRDDAEANKIVSLLESKGIPAFITNKNSNYIRKWSMGGLSVFVHINEQRQEALNVINNPEYRVKNKVNISRFVKKVNNTKIHDVNAYIIESLMKALGFLLVLGILIYAVTQNT